MSCVVARSFARIFFRNCLNRGLPCFVCPEAVDAADDGSEIRVDLTTGEMEVEGTIYRAEPVPEFMRNLLESGGLVEYGRRRLAAEDANGD